MLLSSKTGTNTAFRTLRINYETDILEVQHQNIAKAKIQKARTPYSLNIFSMLIKVTENKWDGKKTTS